jgi:hypothetical protein
VSGSISDRRDRRFPIAASVAIVGRGRGGANDDDDDDDDDDKGD